MNKVKGLAKIEDELEANSLLPLYGKANLVFGVGNPDSPIVFIGEAPGAKEDELRQPFVGRAGKLLNKMLETYKMPRESVYITNIVKRRPPDNRDPLPEEIEAYSPYLKKELDIVKPKIIATLGRFSMNYFLPNVKISDSHGKIFKIDLNQSSNKLTSQRAKKLVLIYPLYHPAAAMRSLKMMESFKKDFKKLPKILKQ